MRSLHLATASPEMSSRPTTTSEVTNSMRPGKKGLPWVRDAYDVFAIELLRV